MIAQVNSHSPRLEAVILDFDGVIVDSETPEYEAHRTLFEESGGELSLAAWTAQVGVWEADDDLAWYRRLCASCPNPPTLERFRSEKRRLFSERLSLVTLSGIDALLDTLVDARVPVAIASSSPARWVLGAAARLGVADRVRTIVTAEDVARRKPAPDVYLEALRRLEARAANSVAIEDSAPGLRSALAAGLKTVVIPHRLTELHDLRAAHTRVSSAVGLTLHRLRELVAGDAENGPVPIK